MLTKRIIPCLDVDAGRVVKGVSFGNLRDAGDPAELASAYDHEGADELVFLDITASSDRRDLLIDVVTTVSKKVFIPLTVGGGIRTIDDFRTALRSGADKVSINTAAIFEPNLIKEGAKAFGSQCTIVAIDARRIQEPLPISDSASGLSLSESSRWQVYSHGGRNPTNIDVEKWAQHVVDLGAGEILLTSMDTDGHQNGYDLELVKTISENVQVPVIASGGAGDLADLHDAFVHGKADAVLAASIFHFGIFSIREAKEFLSDKGLPIRF